MENKNSLNSTAHSALLPRATLARRKQFSTAHLYEQALFSHEKNVKNFGACFSPYGHGHNYVVELFVEGSIDPKTGMVIDVRELDGVLKAITEPLDHHHLNFDVSPFISRPPETARPTLVPTTENIAIYLVEKAAVLLAAFPSIAFVKLRLFETDDLWVEISVEGGPHE